MPIILACSCGKVLKVDDQHRGKNAKCPACGNLVLVEPAPSPGIANADKAVATDDSTKRFRATIVDDEPDMPEIRKPVRRPTDVKRKRLSWVVVGACLAVIASGIICGMAWYFH